MYNDQSSNPITAMQGVDTLLGGLHAGLAAIGAGVDYSAFKGAGVSAADYNAVVMAHNELAAEVRRLQLLVELKDKHISLLQAVAQR